MSFVSPANHTHVIVFRVVASLSVIMIPVLVMKRSRSKQDYYIHWHLLLSLSSRSFHTTAMRAILIKDGKGPIENLYIGETATPAVKSGEVLVKVRTAECKISELQTRLSRHIAQITSDRGLFIKSHGCFATPGPLSYPSGFRDSRS